MEKQLGAVEDRSRIYPFNSSSEKRDQEKK